MALSKIKEHSLLYGGSPTPRGCALSCNKEEEEARQLAAEQQRFLMLSNEHGMLSKAPGLFQIVNCAEKGQYDTY